MNKNKKNTHTHTHTHTHTQTTHIGREKTKGRVRESSWKGLKIPGIFNMDIVLQVIIQAFIGKGKQS